MGCIGVRQFMVDVAITVIGKKWELYFNPGGNRLSTTLWRGFVQAGSIRCVKE